MTLLLPAVSASAVAASSIEPFCSPAVLLLLLFPMFVATTKMSFPRANV
jgi:hypothetical protein